MNIIFLDIDGVLTSARVHIPSGHGGAWRRFDPIALEFIEKVGHRWPAKIVLSSTWRDFFDYRSITHIFHNSTIPELLHSDWKTKNRQANRGLEVEAWLSAHPNVENYIILDDNSDFLPHQMKQLIQTHEEEGMLSKHYQLVLNKTQLRGKL